MAQLLSSNISGNLIISQSANVAGNLLVAGYNILNEIFQADNTTRVTANSASAQSAVSLNFVNTATVTVSVTSGGTGVANIGFTSTAGGSGTVTQVNTGTGLAGGPITVSGTISANIANTTIQGVTKLIDSVTSTDTANAATGAAVKTAYDQATTAYGQANSAYTQANAAFSQANTANTTAVSAYGQANAAYAQANTANSTAVAAYEQANAAYIRANTANSIAISAYGQANLAYSAANNAANTVRVTANSGTAQSAVSLNFINTASIRVSVGAGSAGNANIAFDFIGSATTTFPVSTNTAGPTVTATGINFNNTATIRVNVGAGITSNANVSFDYIGPTGGGGSGINTFPVSANSGATVTANGINFVNTSTAIFSTVSGTTGNANVQLTVIPAFTTEINTSSTLNVTGRSTFSNAITVGMTNDLDALRVTQIGTGNVIVFEDNTNPDSTPFVIDNIGRVGIGTTTPTTTLDIVGSANVSASLNVGGYNILNRIFQADNTVRVTANSGSAQSAVSLNFVNTATVLVSVGAGTTGNANVSFSVNTSKIIFVGTTAPSSPAVNDLWVDTN